MLNIQAQIIKWLFPGLGKGECRRLRELANQKKVPFLDEGLEFNLRGIAASMIRHERTAYDDIIGIVGKTKAREMIRGAVNKRLKTVTGRDILK